jgi:hypothetical protein
MRVGVVRVGLWAILCAIVLWSIAEPSINPFQLRHPRTIAVSALAMLCGTRALFGAWSRGWSIAYLVLAALPAALFGISNFVLERKLGLAEFGTYAVFGIAVRRFFNPNVRAFLDGSFREGAKLILINAAVLICLLVVSEGMARLLLSDFDPARRTDNEYGNPFWLQFQPYLMFSVDGPMDIKFRNARNPGDVEIGHLVTNNMGFRMAEPVRFDVRRPKAQGERVVLFTGGSAAWGAGATSNDTTIAARMQVILNEAQSTHRYVVISLSSAGWISIQSVLAITLYGLNFDPDWVVGMDGINDIEGACGANYGAGRDRQSYAFDKYFRGYLYHQSSPTFYRGAWENELVRVSAAYRMLTGQRYVPEPPQLTAKWGEVELALTFYELAYDRLFRVLSSSKAKMLVSTQPHLGLYKADFGAGPDRLQEIAARHADAECRKVPYIESHRYFFPRLKQVSQDLVARWKDKLDIRYLNMTELVPEDADTRRSMRWGPTDDIHLTDRGQDFVAHIYARTILDADGAPEH